MSDQTDAVKPEATADAAPTESAPVVEKQSAADSTDVMEASLEDLTDDVEKEETDGEQPKPAKEEAKAESEADKEQPAEETKTETPQEGEKPVNPKSENRYQKLANENRELRDQLLRVQSQETQVATEQELLNQVNPETGDYYTPQEAERIARHQANQGLQQQLQQDRQQLEVAQSQQALEGEAVNVLKDFPELNPESPNYDQATFDRYSTALSKVLVRDQQGEIIGAHLSPYELAQTITESVSYGATKGQVKAQKATEKMLANADVPSNAGKATPKEDPMLAAFDAEAAR